MLVKVVIPKLSLRAEEAELVKWLKNEGDRIQEKEPILEIVTEKATVELESPAAGTLAKIVRQAGETVNVGEMVAVVATGVEDAAEVESFLRSAGGPNRGQS